MNLYGQEHIHLWTRTLDGTEMANALYESHIDASLDFCAIAQQMTYNHDNANIQIEDVVNSFEDNGRGMYAGVPGLVIVISKCDGNCHSPIWN